MTSRYSRRKACREFYVAPTPIKLALVVTEVVEPSVILSDELGAASAFVAQLQPAPS